VVEVIEPGSDTHVQDLPGRQGLWHIGVPPSGPMDSYSFRLANKVVGNEDGAAVFECSIHGPTPLFQCQATVAIVGTNSPVFVDGTLTQSGVAIRLGAGQKLSIGTATNGSRTYLAI
jgi:urea carboxylase/allophanate hydrolase